MRNPLTWVAEQIDGFTVPGWGGLRTLWRTVASGFFPQRPYFDRTVVDYNTARQLYRNDSPETNLGAGFAKPIIDRAVEFMGLPSVTSDDEEEDTFLNESLHDHWAAQIQEAFRNAIRDSKTILHLKQPRLTNPLVSEKDRTHLKLALEEPESTTIIYAPDDDELIEKAIIVHEIDFDDTTLNVEASGVGTLPKVKTHTVWEIITPVSYTYYDKTDNRWLESWATGNDWKFVPLIEMWNEFDTTLSGGQSDLESVFPFLKAFHEVLLQGLQAHKYHSIPKLAFQVKDVKRFMVNNFPGVINEATGQPNQGAKITWEGKEIIFFAADETGEFIEAESVLGDTKTLLDFLIDCISIAAETPKWALMRSESGVSEGAISAETGPFEKKIRRKRQSFAPYIQRLCKMALVINGKTPVRKSITWDTIRTEDLAAKAQAVEQLLMGIELALARHLMSDETAMKVLAHFFPEMNTPEIERKLAESNFEPDIIEADATVDAPPGGGGSSNGRSGAKAVPKKVTVRGQG